MKSFLRSLLPRGTRIYPVIAGPMRGMSVSVDISQDTQVVRGIYEKAVLEWMQSVIKPGMKCVDIGAAEGNISLFMSKLVGSNGLVTSFEPSARITNLELLIRANSKLDLSTIQLVPKSVGRSVTKEMISLDHYVDESSHYIDFIKIDVDGYETDVLIGANKSIKACRPYVMVEIHSVQYEEFVVSFFHNLEYETSVVSPPSHEYRPIEHNRWVFCNPIDRHIA
jgi:hypothetical protein